MLPRSLTENGRHGKIFGPKDLFCSCFELSGDINVGNGLFTPNPSSPRDRHSTTKESNNVDFESKMFQRRAISLIQPHASIIDSLERVEDDALKDLNSTANPK